MDKAEFIKRLEALHDDYAKRVGRDLNKNALGPEWRKFTRHFTFVFYKLGLTGNQVTVLHLIAEGLVVVAILFKQPFVAMILLAVSHILDSADGDLARIRNQENPVMAEVDYFGHLITNLSFWLVLYFLFPETQKYVVVILGALTVLVWFRRGTANSDRVGQRSKLWMLLAKPTNIMVIYISFILSVIFSIEVCFIYFYAAYLLAGVIYQSMSLVKRAL